MKKILSTLVMCVILGVGNVWAQGKVQVNAYACINEKSTTNLGGGEVHAHAASRDQWSGSDWNSGERAIKSQIEGSEALGRWSQTHYKVSYSADAYPNNGYYFSHWLNEEGKIITGKGDAKNGIKDIEHPWVGSGIAPVNVYAIFKPVSITTDKSIIQIDSKDKEQYAEETITFNVVGVDAMSDFLNSDVLLSGDSRFSIPAGGGAKFSGDKNNGTVTVTIRYMDDNHHVLNAPFPTATLTLTSAGEENSLAITITATSDLSPYFTVSPSPCDFSPSNPLELGAETQTKTLNVSASSITAAEGTWSAYFKDSEDAGVKGYALDASDPQNPKVLFTPQAAYNNQANIETILCVKCEYQDATPQSVPYVQEITLSADVGKVFTINALTNAIMTFDVIDYSETNNPVSMEYPVYTTLLLSDFHVTEDLHGVTYATTIEGKGSLTDKIIVTAQSNLTPGEHVSTLVYKEKDGDLETSLTINVPIRLAKPIVEVVEGIGLALELDWQDIYGASSYIVKSGETVLATILSDGGTLESTCTITNIAGKQLITGVEYSFTVTAVYESNTFGNRTSDEVTATPSMPSTVTIDNASTLELYTGTEMFVEGHSTYGKYPYHKKQQIDLTALFNEGVAAFDKVFIFGLTINNDASTVTVNGVTAPKITQFTTNTNSNAVTPCYIYNKSGNNYVLSKTIDNVNITTQPAEFKISTTSGQKIYLTGYVPYASCGTTWEENAVFQYTGTGTVDIYLDNLELYARSKAVTGSGVNRVPTKNFTVNTSSLGGLMFDTDINLSLSPLQMTVFTRGSGAAFAFTTTSTSSSTKYQPTIHLRGYNVLESTSGCNIFVDVDIAGKKMQMSAQQHSSPIQIQVNKTGHANKCETELTLDDIWVGTAERTNGYLNLANRNVRLAPTIDLGDEYSTLTFNGGQYYLSNAANDPNLDQLFTVSYAISYRLKSMYDGLAVMYGLGDDQPGAKVRFKDGSFTCAELPETHFQEALYHNRFSMKCPLDTKVDGGTFNSDVLVCSSTDSKGGSPTNSNGAALCKVPIPAISTTAKGLAVLPTGWMNIAVDNGAKTDTLGYYGIKSLAPTTIYRESGEVMYEKGVNMLLPSDQICFLEMVRVPTVFCNPLISTTAVGTTIERGGNLTVPYTYTAGSGEEMTKVQLTSRFVYTEVDDYLRYANKDGYQTPLGTNLTIADDANAYVSNTKKYVIKDKIYWIRPVVANEWKMVVPPFDVSNIYVVESYPEAKLLADFGDGKKITGDQIYNARIAQAKRMLNFMFYWLYDDERAYDSDLWSKINSTPYSPFVAEWVGFETKTDDADPSNDQLAYTPSIQQLYHFTGSNWDANYYLYESDGEWEYSAEEGFITDWELVTTQSMPRTSGTPKTIMKKGGIYAMSFPYTVGKHDPDAAWDYWTGKYIIMEGYPTEHVDEVIGDAQVLSGTSTDWNNQPLSFTVFADYSGDGASLRGNQTFGQLTLQKTNDFFLKSDNTFEPFNSTKSINPGEGFLLANISAPSGMPQRRIASIDIKSGAVTYEEGEDSPTTSVTAPTIAGDRTIVVYTIPNGLGVIPIVPQYVSIYNTAGQLVISQYISGETQFDLPSGIYLISGETDRAKAMVK